MAIKKNPISPRQKMINLIYVVLLALLAINVSPEVLDGYEMLRKSLHNATEYSENENTNLLGEFQKQMHLNPMKVRVWKEKAELVKERSDSLCKHIDILIEEIESCSDAVKDKADPVNAVLFSSEMKGKTLRREMEEYKKMLLLLLPDHSERENVMNNLSTEGKTLETWESSVFKDKPSVVAIAMLTKIQSDIRYTENAVLHSLVNNIDKSDVRVNEMTAFVIPESNTVIKGNAYKGKVILAAVDSTNHPTVCINNGNGAKPLPSNTFERYCGQTGTFSLNGYILTNNKEGETIKSEFSQPYTVIEPMATIAADLTSILYIGYDNPISISVPGVRNEDIYATLSGGTIREKAKGKYIVRPSAGLQIASIKVYVKNQGKAQMVAETAFKVRKLPEPSPFLPIGGTRFHSGRIARQELLSVKKLNAAIDDGILDVSFRVTGFDMVAIDGIGNAIPISSVGADFSSSQKEVIRNMQRGQRFFITHIRAIGPDNTERRLSSSMEVIIK